MTLLAIRRFSILIGFILLIIGMPLYFFKVEHAREVLITGMVFVAIGYVVILVDRFTSKK